MCESVISVRVVSNVCFMIAISHSLHYNTTLYAVLLTTSDRICYPSFAARIRITLMLLLLLLLPLTNLSNT